MSAAAVLVAGAGMTRFEKSDAACASWPAEAVRDALDDAGVGVDDVEAAYVGNAVAGLVTGQEMIRGQVMLRPLGIEGIPIFNVENACASAAQRPAPGLAGGRRRRPRRASLCLGAEKLTHEDKTVGMRAIGTAIDVEQRAELAAESARPAATAASARSSWTSTRTWRADYMQLSGASAEDFAEVVVKNQHNGGAQPARPVRRRAERRARCWRAGWWSIR